MQHYIKYCKHCEVEYTFQASGNHYTLEHSEKYNDENYCPRCKKAILDVLSTIWPVNEVLFVETDEITLDELVVIREKQLEDHKAKMNSGDPSYMFPLTRPVLCTCYNSELKEFEKADEILHDGKIYRYYYFPSKKEEVKIYKKVRRDRVSKEIITDKFRS